ncbi:MAG: ATP-dependent Clp protease ATP-binding subunit ClpA, partial [Lentisphaeria bacterium]|nr:ATP-dependent Clp protease ATP-binding subunit ClpA [Lentisphaeria bacterium]
MSDRPILSREVKDAFQAAFQAAVDYNHEHVVLEHLLYSLIRDEESENALTACGCDIKELRKQLEDYFTDALERMPEEVEPIETLAFQRVIQRALNHVLSCNKLVLETTDLLIALYEEQDSNAVFFLESQGISRFDLVRYVSHNEDFSVEIDLLEDDDDDDDDDDEIWDDPFSADDMYEEDDEEAKLRREKKKKMRAEQSLESFTVNLTRLAEEGKIDKIIGRKLELRRVMRTLCRRRKNNPLLVGEPGVGKTAIAEGLALMIFEEKVPEKLRNAEIYA